MNFFYTFRGRLLLILAFLLIATLGLQYYLNLKSQEENTRQRKRQENALVAGIALGFNGMQSDDRLKDFVSREGQPYFNEQITQRIKDIIIINNKWQVEDSLSPEYLPTSDDGKTKNVNLRDIKNLPPLVEANRLGTDRDQFPNADPNVNADLDGEAHAIPIETNRGRWYVMVILKTDQNEDALKAAQPLIYTLGILLVSTLVTIFLVWRFTRPIANLSKAAQSVAAGDLSFRVKDVERTDEIGQLATQFNEMTAELEKSRQLEAQLREAEKSAVVGRLGSAIAHEIRNPLNYINLTLDHLRAKFAPVEDGKREPFEKLTAQLKQEVARINNQISDFLNYSRPSKANLQPIDARKVIEDSLHIVEPQAAECGIKISVVEREDVPKILGDAEFLRSVFNNLFINAVHSMEKTGGNLNVKISPDAEFVRIEVCDTGIGISEANQAKIFEPYFSTKETGTGLGLAIVQKIVEQHNGTIDVASKENEGTKFTVKLPKA